ncbi:MULTISPECIES: hypothetical protein [unclassified Rhizobium]|uniref:hypothetical protein n=1 Tax=unclassified Rhizobium TaxID=2613769 RepID=UPI0006F4B549|nr:MULTISPECIES: hypothetical protein [unclassified Rhizobium]KQV43259.1 hypothetical protein ASC86_00035 [Rhizobium sp. Root1212]KRD37444.1 hypothetical protein ASE37_00035 [Rhizobium sp. Root268]
MADRPILFSGAMVRALLAGTKTQTRRTLKAPYGTLELTASGWKPIHTKVRIGDRLYVREHWRTDLLLDALPPRSISHGGTNVQYIADEALRGCDKTWVGPGKDRRAMHMPRWASRLTLTVTDVRVERLQDISENDAVAEGCFKGKASGRVFNDVAAMHLGGDEWASARDWYADLWERINGEGTWDQNPWVVAYTFTVERWNIDTPSPAPRAEPTPEAGREGESHE